MTFGPLLDFWYANPHGTFGVDSLYNTHSHSIWRAGFFHDHSRLIPTPWVESRTPPECSDRISMELRGGLAELFDFWSVLVQLLHSFLVTEAL